MTPSERIIISKKIEEKFVDDFDEFVKKQNFDDNKSTIVIYRGLAETFYWLGVRALSSSKKELEEEK